MSTEIKARPILFSAPMIRALLEGTKTQTRRIIKPQPNNLDMGACDVFDAKGYHPSGSGKLGFHFTYENGQRTIAACPYGKPGDYLWCRETWCPVDDREHGGNQWIDYRATPRYEETHPAGWENAADDPNALKWKPSIHMPRAASRLTLKITDVRVQRLQDINDYDAILEGALLFPNRATYDDEKAEADARGEKPPLGDGPRTRFKRLWESINGKGSWERNDWVWALSFTVHKQNIDALLNERRAA